MRTSPLRVLITGMSGTGKSSVVVKLREKGFRAIDMDDPGHSFQNADGHQLWNEDLVREALDNASAEPLFISGCAENQAKFYAEMTDIVLLSAPRDVMLDRLAARSNNPYGKTVAEREEILSNLEEVEPLLRRRATCEIVTTIPLEKVVEQILENVGLETSDDV